MVCVCGVCVMLVCMVCVWFLCGACVVCVCVVSPSIVSKGLSPFGEARSLLHASVRACCLHALG